MFTFFKKIRSYTLTELMVVIVIVSVISGVAVPIYMKTIEKSKARDARTTLRLVHHGQRIYKSERGLHLSISEDALDADNRWKDLKLDNPNKTRTASGYIYSVEISGSGPASSFVGKARRLKDSGTYVIDQVGNITNPDGKLPPTTY